MKIIISLAEIEEGEGLIIFSGEGEVAGELHEGCSQIVIEGDGVQAVGLMRAALELSAADLAPAVAEVIEAPKVATHHRKHAR